MSSRHVWEQRLGPVVAFVGSLPRFVPFLLVMGLLLAGLFLQGVAGAGILLLLAAGLGALLVLAWPALAPNARAVRVAVLSLLVARAVTFVS
jgi:hypothetical protein